MFVDEAYGEFMHEISGTASAPAPIDVVKFTSIGRQPVTKEIPINYKNNLLEREIGRAHV